MVVADVKAWCQTDTNTSATTMFTKNWVIKLSSAIKIDHCSKIEWEIYYNKLLF